MPQRNEKHAIYVKSQYGLIPTKLIASNLNIAVHAVRQLARRLGVARKDTPRMESAKVKMKQNNVPTEKLSKMSNSENPKHYRVKPFNPETHHYVRKWDANNQREYLAEVPRLHNSN